MAAPKSAKTVREKEFQPPSSQPSSPDQDAQTDAQLREELFLDDSESELATDLIAEPTPVKAEGEDFDELEGEQR